MTIRSIHHVIGQEERFGTRLTDRLQKSEGGEVVLATAFFTYGAYQEMHAALVATLEAGTTLTALLGRFDYVTEPRAVRALLKLEGRYPTQVRVLFDQDYGFHYKLALFRRKGHVAVLVGSSNLTPKGLGGVGEINTEILNQRNLYRDFAKDLSARVARGDPAATALAAYEVHYRRNKKWRDARHRAEQRGNALWKAASRVAPAPRRLAVGELSPLVHCNIVELVDDQVLTDNATQQRRKDNRQGLSFPKAWIQVPAAFARLLEEGDTFLISDDVNHRIGLASAKALRKVIDERDRKVSVIFYRFQPGRRVSLYSEARYAKARSDMRLGSKEVLQRDGAATALKVLQHLVKRAAK